MKKRKYPENRKPRNTSYSLTYKILNEIGEELAYRIWSEKGMYRGSEELSQRLRIYISPYILRYISHKMNWKRVLTARTLPIVKGILASTMPAEYYKHIIIKEKSNDEQK